ncbi:MULTISPECIES: hypothetical protein [Bradyrhizobium]|uniref:Uncharacterized protein n=1 Tax=Bradyrhizobium diversitatis TaxID=2755406 RepID=A0ABS0P1G1_9BRAD|nr:MULTISPECIES: hypothetical protein [Bradyrhizobium]KYK44858.1 hypothetical protein A1D31_11600 [Bradyrhizobium liaoningense]MBH5387109.1 hypothetical protein [Bradyrhizobium diversitatis]UPJ66074.1 hypothetical protein IVB23_01405 [Bradyrhizobium sp. 191]
MTEPPFDPNTAPRAGNSAQDRAAMRADMNKVALKLREAGIQLYGFYKIHDLVPYWNPLGFDFMCDNWRQLLDAAGKAPRLGSDQINMPGYDPWLQAGVKSVGFTQTGKAPHVHLDIAIDRPGLCRIYILEKDEERRLDALRRARVVTARDTDVFRKIHRRVEGLGIDLDDHIGSHLEAGRLVLDGINFVAKDHKRLLDVLTNLKYPAGNNVFFRGERSGRGHFFGMASFLATDGIGFRQIWQTFPEERPIATPDPRTGPAMDPKASGRFGDSPNLPDLTSVHCAVSNRICNVHIDEMGFVVTDSKGTIIVDPDALRHIFVELLWKTNLQGKLPFWALDNVNFIIPSSPNDFSRVGVSVDIAKFGRVKIALNGSCSADGKMEAAGTLTLGFKF